MLVPVWRSQPGKGRYKINTPIVGNLFCKCFHVGRFGNKSQSVTKPLHHGASDKYASFECIIHLLPYFPANRCHKIVERKPSLAAYVHEHKATRSICIFPHPLACAHLSEKCRLLVSRH